MDIAGNHFRGESVGVNGGLPLNSCPLPTLLSGALLLQIPGAVFWPYFAGAALSLTALFAVWAEVSLARGADKIVSLGRFFFAMPLAIFGAEHFASAKDISQLVPKWIPGTMFWTYFVGAALLAAALSIVLKKHARLAAILLALMFCIFVLTISMPLVVAKPSDRIAWVVMLRDLSFAAGALAFAGTQTGEWRAKGTHKLIILARLVFASVAVFFGVEQLLHPDCVPGVPFARQTPTWIPGHFIWSYVAGLVFVVAGARLLFNSRPRLAATGMGFMVLLLVFFVYVPIWGDEPASISNGLNYIADTLAFAGAVLLLADALPKETQRTLTAQR